MQFHDKEGAIPHDTPVKVFIQAQAVTLFLDTQNNGARGKSTTMEDADPDTTIWSYFPATGAAPKIVTSTSVVSLLCLHAANLGFQCLGLYPHEIGSHPLCLGRDMNI